MSQSFTKLLSRLVLSVVLLLGALLSFPTTAQADTWNTKLSAAEPLAGAAIAADLPNQLAQAPAAPTLEAPKATDPKETAKAAQKAAAKAEKERLKAEKKAAKLAAKEEKKKLKEAEEAAEAAAEAEEEKAKLAAKEERKQQKKLRWKPC
jgi:hypothetical protein